MFTALYNGNINFHNLRTKEKLLNFEGKLPLFAASLANADSKLVLAIGLKYQIVLMSDSQLYLISKQNSPALSFE